MVYGVPPGVWTEVLRPALGRCVFGEHMGNPAPFYSAVRGFTAYVLYGALTQLGGDAGEARGGGEQIHSPDPAYLSAPH